MPCFVSLSRCVTFPFLLYALIRLCFLLKQCLAYKAKYFHYLECCLLEGRNGKKRKEKGVGEGKGREGKGKENRRGKLRGKKG